MFEYKIIEVYSHNLEERNLDIFLNKFGREGWQLVSVETYFFRNNTNEVNKRKFFFKKQYNSDKFL